MQMTPISERARGVSRTLSLRFVPPRRCGLLLAACAGALALPLLAAAQTAQGTHPAPLAPTPPMGWNDWARYQCGYTAQTILDNAHALVETGLAADGYDTVTIDDCWMQKDRDAQGNLQPDPRLFPDGMKSVADAVHALGLKFGIYEDSGSATCDGLAGSGVPQGGGDDHFLQDARLFASWGVDYLKLDGCNLYVPKGSTEEQVYRKAYSAQSAALAKVGRPIVFSESAPAYFQGSPEWYDVLSWVGGYGQLWREGSDMANFHASDPERERFRSVLWNYAYNLPLGRFQKPGNWDDPDFIIAGSAGMTVAESRSQMTLWAMMSAPLILSSNVGALSRESLAILGNKAVIRVDQDPLGRMATLLERDANLDVLVKRLSGGDLAVAVLNHGDAPGKVTLIPEELGLRGAGCTLDARDLWSGHEMKTASALEADLIGHDSAIWRVHASAACGEPARLGTITQIVAGEHRSLEGYTRCLAAPGLVEDCAGAQAEMWTVGDGGELESVGRCLTDEKGLPAMRRCTGGGSQRWNYTRVGNLESADGKCLTAISSGGPAPGLSLQDCGHNLPEQIWSLPN